MLLREYFFSHKHMANSLIGRQIENGPINLKFLRNARKLEVDIFLGINMTRLLSICVVVIFEKFLVIPHFENILRSRSARRTFPPCNETQPK